MEFRTQPRLSLSTTSFSECEGRQTPLRYLPENPYDNHLPYYDYEGILLVHPYRCPGAQFEVMMYNYIIAVRQIDLESGTVEFILSYRQQSTVGLSEGEYYIVIHGLYY